jgi:uncharacterized membrane protein YfcA
MTWLWYVLIGTASGVISGMGIGGGAILIPALTLFFGMEQKTAQNINLIYFIPTAIIALLSHVKQGNIEKKGLWTIILFGILGATSGSMLAIRMDATFLRRLFGCFLFLMGCHELFRREKQTE